MVYLQFMMVNMLVSWEFQITSEDTIIKCVKAVYEQRRGFARYICAYLMVRNSVPSIP